MILRCQVCRRRQKIHTTDRVSFHRILLTHRLVVLHVGRRLLVHVIGAAPASSRRFFMEKLRIPPALIDKICRQLPVSLFPGCLIKPHQRQLDLLMSRNTGYFACFPSEPPIDMIAQLAADI